MSIKNKKGFTIVELLIVIAIIAILVLLAVPKLMGMADKAKIANIQNDVKVHENIIHTKLAEDENFILSSNWEILDNSELSRKKDEFAIFSKSGYVDKKYLFEDKHYKLGSELINSNLKGEFIVSEKGLVFYEDDSLRKVIGGKISPEEEINKTLALDNTLETKLEVKTITQSNNNFANVYKYNQNGFIGELIKKGNVKTEVVSGSYTPEDSKTVSNSIKKTSNSFSDTNAYNSGGYFGELKKNGTASSSIEETGGRYEDTGYWEETGYWEDVCVPGICDFETGWQRFWYSTGTQWVSTGQRWVPSYTTYYTQNYSGTVTKPAVDTRVYSYTQEYEGSVEKGVMPKFPEHIEEQGVKLYPKGEPILNNKTNKYELTYTGIKPEEDNREWGKK